MTEEEIKEGTKQAKKILAEITKIGNSPMHMRVKAKKIEKYQKELEKLLEKSYE